MEFTPKEHEESMSEKIERIDRGMDHIYSTVSILSSALISWLLYMLSKKCTEFFN